VIAGYFGLVNGVVRENIARLNADGSLDPDFNPGLVTDNTINPVNALVLQPDGSILVGGSFSSLGGITCTNLGRLDSAGNPDPTFVPQVGGEVYTLAIQPDGKVLVGGSFGSVGGMMRNNIGRLNLNGLADPDFNPDANDSVYTIVLQQDGGILIGGIFDTVGLYLRHGFGRLYPDGTLDTYFSADVSGYSLSSANSILIQGDNKVIVGGFFSTLAGLTRHGLGRLSLNMSVQQQLNIDNDGTTVVWPRGELGLDLWRVTFEISTDGFNYLALGEGTQIVSGWQLNGVVLPRGQNLWIRARGFFTETGYRSGSSSIIEVVRNVYLTPKIYIPLVIR
jgi:uncharacterized delta-60 repeat protein